MKSVNVFAYTFTPLIKSALIALLFVLFTGNLPAQEMYLRDVITHSARGVEDAVPPGTKLAVLNFDSSAAAFSDYVIEELTGVLVTGRKVTVVDRRNLALIAQEMNLQLSGDVSDESAQAIGRMLGAQSIVSGTLSDMGNFYRFRIRLIDVETAAIQTQIALDLYNDTQVAFLLGGEPSSAPPSAITQEEPAAKDQSGKAANAVNNWLSAEISYWFPIASALPGAGVRYERMLGSRFSLGINAHAFFNSPSEISEEDILAAGISASFYRLNFVIDIPFRWYPYPLGKLFFVGIVVGFHYTHNDQYNITNSFGYEYVLRPIRDTYGFTFGPEIGMKIDVGKAGGFYLEPGMTGIVTFGKRYEETFYPQRYDGTDYKKEEESEIRGGFRVYLGMGWGF